MNFRILHVLFEKIQNLVGFSFDFLWLCLIWRNDALLWLRLIRRNDVFQLIHLRIDWLLWVNWLLLIQWLLCTGMTLSVGLISTRILLWLLYLLLLCLKGLLYIKMSDILLIELILHLWLHIALINASVYRLNLTLLQWCIELG